MRKAILTLPAELRRTTHLGPGQRRWPATRQFTVDTGIPVYFCDPAQPLAARHEREHQRAAAPVLAQGHRPLRALRRRPRPLAAQPQQPASQDPRLHETIGGARRTSCADRLNPPTSGLGTAETSTAPTWPGLSRTKVDRLSRAFPHPLYHWSVVEPGVDPAVVEAVVDDEGNAFIPAEQFPERLPAGTHVRLHLELVTVSRRGVEGLLPDLPELSWEEFESASRLAVRNAEAGRPTT